MIPMGQVFYEVEPILLIDQAQDEAAFWSFLCADDLDGWRVWREQVAARCGG